MKTELKSSGRKKLPLREMLALGILAAALLVRLELPFASPFVLPGLLLPLIPQQRGAWALLPLAVLCAVLWKPLAEGFETLANAMFARSESCQAYEYDYFETGEGNGPLFLTAGALSVLLGSLCSLHAGGTLWGTCALAVFGCAYFGVTPDLFWAVLILLSLLLCALPGEGLWLRGGTALLLTGLLLAGVLLLAPHPLPAVSAGEEAIRDRLAQDTVWYAGVPQPTELPVPEEPEEETPPPPEEIREEKPFPWLIVILAALTLLVLFVPAAIRDRARKRHDAYCGNFESEDISRAVRDLYLHSRRWSDEPAPEEIRRLWNEAAYSDHVLTEQDRETMTTYLEQTEEKVLSRCGLKKRLYYRYIAGN